MKTGISKTVLAGLMVILFYSVKAENAPANNSTTNPELRRTIQMYFRFPSTLMPLAQITGTGSTRVEVLFTTNQSGHVNFVFAKTTDKNLKAEIEKQFLNLPLSGVQENVVHSVVIKFVQS